MNYSISFKNFKVNYVKLIMARFTRFALIAILCGDSGDGREVRSIL